MTRFLASVALIATLSVPAIAYADEAPSRTFTRGGETYVYTSTAKHGAVVLDGRAYPSGSGFHLVVRGDRVGGTSGGVPVSFFVKDAQAKLSTTELASR